MLADVRISCGIAAHRKVKKLIRRLGTDAAWRLVCLYAWAGAYHPSGDLAGLDADDIELAVDWPGNPGELVATLLDLRLLDVGSGGMAIHDWSKHNAWAAGFTQRSAKARWKAACRHVGREEADRLFPDVATDAKPRDNGAEHERVSDAQCNADCNAQCNAPSPKALKAEAKAKAKARAEALKAHTTGAAAAPVVDPAPNQSLAGRACKLMVAAGCFHTNPRHPDLLAALDVGVTPEELGATAAEAVAKGGIQSPFAWSIRVAVARRLAAGVRPWLDAPRSRKASGGVAAAVADLEIPEHQSREVIHGSAVRVA